MAAVYIVIASWFLLSSIGLRQEYEKRVKLQKEVASLQSQIQASSLKK